MPDEFVPSLLRKGGWEEEITRRADPAHATIKRADEQPHMAAEVKAVEVRGQEAVNWVAKQDATTGYTPQDYDVLNDYWGPNYKVVNASLRGLSPRDSIETFQGEVLIDQWKWRMNDIINKSAPVPDDIRAYRGAGKGVSAAFDRGDFKPGYRIVDQGFMSVTVDEGVAGFFATGHGKGDPTDGIIFEFVVPKGAKAAYNKSWVAEMTFDRGTAIEVLEAYVDDSPEAVALFGGPIRRVKGVLIPNDPSAAF
jgi:hypothetical protein